MADVMFVAITVAFFAICMVYVNWCDRIIGSDELISPINATSPVNPEPSGTISDPSRELAACSR